MQKGDDSSIVLKLGGEAAGDGFGVSVALSQDGTILAAGTILNKGNGDESGHIRVLKFGDSNNHWSQLGQDVDDEAEGDWLGIAVALSADGTIVAAGAMHNGDNGNRSGHVRVFEFDKSNNRWYQLGQGINGEAENDYFGTSVALSANGTIVAAGAKYNDSNGTDSGHVYVCKFDKPNNRWNQLGQVLDGEAAYDYFGDSITLSANGTILAARDTYNDGKN